MTFFTPRLRASLSAVLLGLSLCTLAAAADCPFNGGFDLTHLTVPLGWTVQGKWLARPEARKDGKNGILLRPDLLDVGDRLTAEGYVLAGPGQTLTVSLQYVSPGGGPALGLIFCDVFGRAVGEGLLEDLPAADTWTPYQRTIELKSESCPVSYSAVRPFLKIDSPLSCEAGPVRLDSLVLTREHPETAMPTVPEMRIEDRPNLLTNPDMLLAEDGTMAGWTALDRDGFGAHHAVVMPITDSKSGTLALTGAEHPAAWLSDLTAVDVSLPYLVRAEVTTADLTAAQATLLVRVMDPVDAGVVWLQQTVPAEATKGPTEFRVSLRRLTNISCLARVQIALLLNAGGVGAATMAKVALEPEPLSLVINGVGGAGCFKQPKDVSLFVTATNNSGVEIQPRACLKIVDNTGAQVAYEEPKLVPIPAKSAVYFPWKPKLDCPGEYTAQVRVSCEGKEQGGKEFKFTVSPE